MAVAGAEASVTGLADRISTVLDGLLEPGTEVAFVNFPNIANVGDAAIWLGTRRALEAGGIRVLHMCEPATYSPRLVARAVGEHGTILLQGGGNLGDAYVPQHSARERVLADFPRARVIQLPQTVWFRDPARVERFRRLAEAHSDLTLMLRERRSLEWAQAELQVPVVLCPDMAFALGALERAEPTCDLLWLSRRDGESRGEKLPALGPSERREDWRARTLVRQPGGKRLGAWLALNRRAVPVAAADGRLSGLASAAAAATFAPLARARLGAGITLLSRGRVVVTDRLHGHILALLLGIPNVLLDNSYGKCRAVWETWTEGLPGASWAADPDSALMAARELLATEGAAA